MSNKKAPARKKPVGDIFFSAREPQPFEFGGEKVFIHEVDSDTYIEYCGLLSKKAAPGSTDEERAAHAKSCDRAARAFLIARCVHTESGERRFSDLDIQKIASSMRPHVFIQMSSIAMNMTGLLDGIGEAEKN